MVCAERGEMTVLIAREQPVDVPPLATADSTVPVFRVVTFWAPALIGLLITKRLRRLRVI
jgi:hypothetical protein